MARKTAKPYTLLLTTFTERLILMYFTRTAMSLIIIYQYQQQLRQKLLGCLKNLIITQVPQQQVVVQVVHHQLKLLLHNHKK